MQSLSSLPRPGTHAPCNESAEALPGDHQEVPAMAFVSWALLNIPWALDKTPVSQGFPPTVGAVMHVLEGWRAPLYPREPVPWKWTPSAGALHHHQSCVPPPEHPEAFPLLRDWEGKRVGGRDGAGEARSAQEGRRWGWKRGGLGGRVWTRALAEGEQAAGPGPPTVPPEQTGPKRSHSLWGPGPRRRLAESLRLSPPGGDPGPEGPLPGGAPTGLPLSGLPQKPRGCPRRRAAGLPGVGDEGGQGLLPLGPRPRDWAVGAGPLLPPGLRSWAPCSSPHSAERASCCVFWREHHLEEKWSYFKPPRHSPSLGWQRGPTAWTLNAETLHVHLLSPISLFHPPRYEKSSRKTSISALLAMPKPLTVWITTNYGESWKRWAYQTTWPASWETCRQVRKQQLERDMEQQTGSK